MPLTTYIDAITGALREEMARDERVFIIGEDVGAIGLTWIATEHPYIAAAIVLVLLVLVVLVMRWVIRALQGLFRRARTALAGVHETGTP